MTLIACRTNSFQDLWSAQIKMTRYEDKEPRPISAQMCYGWASAVQSNMRHIDLDVYEIRLKRGDYHSFRICVLFYGRFLLSWPFVDPDWQRLFHSSFVPCFFLSDIRFSHSVSTAMMSITNVMILYGHEDVWQQRWWARNWVADVC